MLLSFCLHNFSEYIAPILPSHFVFSDNSITCNFKFTHIRPSKCPSTFAGKPTHIYLYLSLHPINNHPNMPCFFSGIFYVNNISQNRLTCQFQNEISEIEFGSIIYYFPLKAEKPFSEAYDTVKANGIYYISGTFAVTFDHCTLVVVSHVPTNWKMNATSVYPIPIYNTIDLSVTQFKIPTNALPPMFMTISTIGSITQG